jgi:hypothetical protein
MPTIEYGRRQMRITRDRFVNLLGPAPKPRTVWQEQFDGFNEKLSDLAQMDWDRVPDDYLWYYFLDLAYVELQPDLFRHLFPTCLKRRPFLWRRRLLLRPDARPNP